MMFDFLIKKEKPKSYKELNEFIRTELDKISNPKARAIVAPYLQLTRYLDMDDLREIAKIMDQKLAGSWLYPRSNFNYGCPSMDHLSCHLYKLLNDGCYPADPNIESDIHLVLNLMNQKIESTAFTIGKEVSVKISLGNILHSRADMVVVPTNPKLSPKFSMPFFSSETVFDALQKQAGAGFRQYIEAYRSKKCLAIGGALTVPLDSFTNYKAAVLTAAPTYQSNGDQKELKLQLMECYLNALAAADEEGCESIVFPLIGAGACGWGEQSFALGFYVMENYFRQNPDSCIMKVDFLLYSANLLKMIKDSSPQLLSPAEKAHLNERISENGVVDKQRKRQHLFAQFITLFANSLEQLKPDEKQSTLNSYEPR
ncbi:hypothetical protein EAS68_13030 [Legionella jordanis]|nr:hypothetical protein EAS68_13030 [Legionella jordanis]